MPLSTVFEGKIGYLQVLDKDGNVDKTLEPDLPRETLEKMYRYMVYARMWDRKCVALQRTGRMFTYAPIEGEEATAVGTAMGAAREDWLFPTYREANITYYIRGHPPYMSNLIWMGVEDGLKLDRKLNCYPYVIPIATQLPHAVGAAYALKQRGEKSACIAIVGDGGTSEGDFHDAMNFAGVWNAPCVILVANNQWAISVPRKMQTKSETLAQKALAYGVPGLQVDGNDILAVYKAVKEATDRAHEGKGPTLIECVTYRMGAHTTADDPKKYRSEQELAYWRERDPIERFRTYLKAKGVWTDAFGKSVEDDSAKEIEAAVAQAEAYKPDPKGIFRYLFAEPTKNVEEQQAECFGEKEGGESSG